MTDTIETTTVTPTEPVVPPLTVITTAPTVKKGVLRYIRDLIHLALKIIMYPVLLVLHVINTLSAKALNALYKF